MRSGNGKCARSPWFPRRTRSSERIHRVTNNANGEQMATTAGLTAEVAIVGAGAAGLTASLALAGAGRETVLVAKPALPDNRTTALLAGSVTALETLGVWPALADRAAPLRILRIVDDTTRLLRAPEARFVAGEIGLSAFGHNIENQHLLAALQARAAELPALHHFEGEVEAIDIDENRVTLRLKGGNCITARLVIGADGPRSLCRTAAGIETVGWRYPQSALTFNIGHTRPHDFISTEFHTERGPFTLVPLPGARSSVVCVADTAEIERLRALDDAILAPNAEQRSHSILGKINVEHGRGVFSLVIETARSFGRNRIALIGDAAHRLPPIGAQGLNLGLRDAATIAELVAQARGGDPGDGELLARYDRLRRVDVTSRNVAVDLLNRTLLSGFLPVQGARGFGFYLLNRIGPLRRAVMREGVSPITSQPRLMRGEALI
jgi:2-octaprenyl-6-methoxyphenol hydroxylase